jgi:hypothetical protein
MAVKVPSLNRECAAWLQRMPHVSGVRAGGRPFGPLTEVQGHAVYVKIMRTGTDPATGRYRYAIPAAKPAPT